MSTHDPLYPLVASFLKHRRGRLKGTICDQEHVPFPTQGEGTSVVHLRVCIQRSLPVVIVKESDFAYQVCIHIGSDEGLDKTTSRFVSLFSSLNQSPLSTTVCLWQLVVLYTGLTSTPSIHVMNVSPKSPTLLLSRADLWGGLVTAVLLSLLAALSCLSLSRWFRLVSPLNMLLSFFQCFWVSAERAMWCFVWMAAGIPIANEGVKRQFIPLCCYIVFKEGKVGLWTHTLSLWLQ